MEIFTLLDWGSDLLQKPRLRYPYFIMCKQRVDGRKLIFLTLTLLVGAFLFVNQPLFAQTQSIGSQQQTGQVGESGTASDFNNDVQLGVQNLVLNPIAQVQQKEIGSQDYKSTWDEFGTNVLIDGTTPPAEVDRKIIEDTIQAVQIEETYNQQEVQYLENTHLTPEEIQAMEESGGSDVPPGEFIDPNPSAESNPDVSVSASEDQGQNNVEESTTTETSAFQATSTPGTDAFTPELSTSSEETIFDAILQGEQTLVNPGPESTPPPPEPIPSESPPVQ